MLTTTDIFI